ncbi:MAG: HlyD family efflux transporter periplasmic adaptor subunit, partial [Phycisphaerales bacterium]|nr:HlyD family efflux transporter periplasmic adaptor subunit [Phycisphaerales bacterium]
LVLVQRANRSAISHVLSDTRGFIRSFFMRGRTGRRIIASAALLFSAWFFFGATEYAITAPSVLKPADPRQLSAPFDGVLAGVDVVPGDIVNAGDVLCRLDTRDLELARDQIAAELGIAENQRLRALAENNAVEARVAAASVDLARLRLAQNARRIEQAVVRAPVSGIVVQGDLRQHVGAVMRVGDPLIMVAPLDGWRLEIESPESAIDDVRAGLTGRFASNARPEESRAFEISRVRPAAENRRNHNVFIAEADITIDPSWVKLGMEGHAYVDVGAKPVWWVWTHKAVDYLRLNFWL